jgi:hypothetical protein
MKIQLGEVFGIKIANGYGFLQYVGDDQWGIQIIRILEPINQSASIAQEEVNIPERYTVHFVLKAAARRKLVERVGLFTIPANYMIPTKARDKHTIRGQSLGWHIVDQKTLHHELKVELSEEDLLLPPHGHPNDTLLKEWLEKDWRLKNWK